MTVPTITLNDQTTIPQLGFGTFQVPPARTAETVAAALEVGYRHLDTAQMYDNEEGVGQGIAASGLPREDLYVTTKLNNSNHAPDDVRRSFDESFAKLGLDYVDLFLIHWPPPQRGGSDLAATWKAMVELQQDGRLRSVGVSNFHPAHLDQIIEATGVLPVVNQIEAHPYLTNDAVRAATHERGITVEAWSPIARGKVMDDEVVQQIAQRHGKTPSQVTLRWHVERGDVVFPKSMREERMRENFEIFDFQLSPDEVEGIGRLDQGEGGRLGPNPETMG
jgi:2,5-diketo-D-gluconate reductase A